jgi:glycosyltransferase involved in cell wall biosynthesis
VDSSNKVVLTWFHGTDDDIEFIESLPEGSRKAAIIHTACTLSKKELVRWGAEEEKIVVIPLGVDLSIFKQADEKEKKRIREEMGIPNDAVCIGSFQKDGEGWEEGNKPKLIKGPDIFCDVIEKVKKRIPVFVLLTGPARGYVKNRLDDMGVPYKHCYLDNYSDIPKYYKALDYYIISSRIEGGPKSVLECSATGIPFVTTKVGMVDDIVVDGQNGLKSEVGDVTGLTNNLIRIIENNDLKKVLIKNGLETAKKHSWPIIADRFYKEIYSKLL